MKRDFKFYIELHTTLNIPVCDNSEGTTTTLMQPYIAEVQIDATGENAVVHNLILLQTGRNIKPGDVINFLKHHRDRLIETALELYFEGKEAEQYEYEEYER